MGYLITSILIIKVEVHVQSKEAQCETKKSAKII